MHVIVPPDNRSKIFEIKVTQANSRLDVFLSIKFPKYSRTKIKKMIAEFLNIIFKSIYL